MKNHNNLLLHIIIAIAVIGVTSCDLIDYHPYDTRVEGKHYINSTNIARIEAACKGRKAIKFVLISDTQRWYDETRDAVNSINGQPGVDFVIHCGDISDFGATREFTLQRDILEKLKMPYVVLLGNHDCLGTGADTFRYVFGEPNFAFNAGDTHFLCINSNAFEYDYSTDIPDFKFIETDRDALPAEVTRTVVAMHAQPTSEQFNNNVAKLFEWEIGKYPGLSFCMCGHGHKTQSNDLFGDGILYYECGAAKHREYVIFTLNSDGSYEYQTVNY